MCGLAAVGLVLLAWNARPPARPSTPGLIAGDVLLAVGAVTVAVGSLRPFVARAFIIFTPAPPPPASTAWSWHTFLAPLTSSIAVAAILAAIVGFRRRLPGGRHLVRWPLYLSGYASVVMIGYLVSEKFIVFGVNPHSTLVPMLPESDPVDVGPLLDLRFGLGAVLMTAGCVLALIGAAVGQLHNAGVQPDALNVAGSTAAAPPGGGIQSGT